MFVLKALTLIVAGALTLVAVRLMSRQLSAAKVRAARPRDAMRRPATRLRQDPRTGVYYPEE